MTSGETVDFIKQAPINNPPSVFIPTVASLPEETVDESNEGGALWDDEQDDDEVPDTDDAKALGWPLTLICILAASIFLLVRKRER